MNRPRLILIFVLVSWMGLAPTFQRNTAGQAVDPWLRLWVKEDGLVETTCFLVTGTTAGELLISHGPTFEFSKFDGYHIETSSLPQPTMSVMADDSGRIWAFPQGDRVSEIFRFDEKDKDWERIHLPEEISIDLTHTLFGYEAYPIDGNQLIAVTSSHDRLFEIDLDSFSSAKILDASTVVSDRLGTPTQMMMVPSRDGGVWIPCEGGAARIHYTGDQADSPWMIEEHPFEEGIHYKNLRNLLEWYDGTLFGVCDLDNERYGLLKYYNSTWSLLYESEESNWIGFEQYNSLFFVALNNSLFAINHNELTVKKKQILPFIFDVFSHRDGSVLFTSDHGLTRYSPPLWQNPKGISSEYEVRLEVKEDAQGNLILVGENFILIRENAENAWTSMDSDQYGVLTFIWRNGLIGNLPDGRLGFNRRDGGAILALDVNSRSFSQVSLQGAQPFRDALFHDGVTMLWGDEWSHIEIFDGNNVRDLASDIYQQVILDAGRKPGEIESACAFVKMSEEEYFIAPGGSGGPLQIRDGEVFLHARDTGYPGSSALSLCRVSDSVLWAGGRDGIYEYDGQSWRVVREGLDIVYCMIVDSQDHVWAASNNGVHCYNPALDSWVHYTVEDGLPSNYARRVYEDSQGRIWASTLQGVRIFHPEADPDPPIVMVPPEKNSHSIFHGGTAQFVFEGIDKWKMTRKERLLFSHRFNDGEWSPFENEFIFTKEGLQLDQNRFEVRAMDVNWNISEPVSWEFTLVLPWYREPMFLLILTVGGILLIIAVGYAVNRHVQLQQSFVSLRAAHHQLKSTQNQLIQSEKMASLGQLVAGVAHEINNPVNFIRSNVEPLREYFDHYQAILNMLKELRPSMPEDLRREFDQACEKHELEYINEDSQKMVRSFEDGSNRIAQIVADLRQYSRVDQEYRSPYQLHEAIDSTLNLLHNAYKNHVTVHKEYGEIPPVVCAPGQISQVLMNLLSNAEQAIEGEGHVWITTRRQGDQVVIQIRDDGHGILPEVRNRIFDPFFTTKSVGQGTGLGLSISQSIIEQHGGTISVESEVGKGTVFTITLPIFSLFASLGRMEIA